MVAPVRYEASLREDPYDVDPDTKNPRVSPGYLGLSASAEVEAPVVYAHSGNPEDYAVPARAGDRRAGQDRARPLLEPLQLPGLQGAHRGARGRGGHPHLLRPRGGRLHAGAGVPGRAVGPREPHPARRDHLRLHRPRRPADAGLALAAGGAPGAARGGAVAASNRGTPAVVEGREAAPREHGRAGGAEGVAGRAPDRVPARRRAGPRPHEGRHGQQRRSQPRGRGADPRLRALPTSGSSSGTTATPGSSGASTPRAAPPR